MMFNSHISQITRLVLFGDKHSANGNSLLLINKVPKSESQKKYGVFQLTLYMQDFNLCFHRGDIGHLCKDAHFKMIETHLKNCRLEKSGVDHSSMSLYRATP